MLYNKTTLINALNEIDQKVETDFAVEITADNCNDFSDLQETARTEFLQNVFGKKVFSLFASSFTVFCNSWADRCDVVKQVSAMGFKNIQTYEPKVDDGKGGSMPDPESKFAVDVNLSESLIFGDHTEKFMAFFKDFIAVVKGEVIYTYAYNADYRLTFSNMGVASLLASKLNKYLDQMIAHGVSAGKLPPKIKVQMKESNLDAWTVSISMAI